MKNRLKKQAAHLFWKWAALKATSLTREFSSRRVLFRYQRQEHSNYRKLE